MGQLYLHQLNFSGVCISKNKINIFRKVCLVYVVRQGRTSEMAPFVTAIFSPSATYD
jgi:hypothetical protein